MQLPVLQDCATLQLTQGRNTLIDASMFPVLNGQPWYTVHLGLKDGRYVYAVRHFPDQNKRWKQRVVGLHQVLLQALRVDHRNHDTLDNRMTNLRPCSPVENVRNTRPMRRRGGQAVSSKYKGVVFLKDLGRYGVRVQIARGQRKYLGSYTDEKQAARVYDAAAREFFGEFAVLNAQLFGDLDQWQGSPSGVPS